MSYLHVCEHLSSLFTFFCFPKEVVDIFQNPARLEVLLVRLLWYWRKTRVLFGPHFSPPSHCTGFTYLSVCLPGVWTTKRQDLCPTDLSVSSPNTTSGMLQGLKTQIIWGNIVRERVENCSSFSTDDLQRCLSEIHLHRADEMSTQSVLIICDFISVNLPTCQSLLVTSSSILAVLSQSFMGLNRASKNLSHLKFAVPAGVE